MTSAHITIKISVLTILAVAIVFLLCSNSYQRTLAQNTTGNQTTALLTYKNPDLGLTMQYPSNWVKQQDNLVRNTFAAFLLKENPFHNSLNFANISLAEVDLRVYPAPQGVTSANLNTSQLDTQGQALINQYKNGTTTLGGLPAIKLTSYVFGGFTQKTMQMWTYIPSKHVLFAIVYIVQPSAYPLYLPAVQQMINSVKIASTSTSLPPSTAIQTPPAAATNNTATPTAPASTATQTPPAAATSNTATPTAPASGGTTPNVHTTPTQNTPTAPAQNVPANGPTQQVPTNPTTNVPQLGSPSIGSK